MYGLDDETLCCITIKEAIDFAGKVVPLTFSTDATEKLKRGVGVDDTRPSSIAKECRELQSATDSPSTVRSVIQSSAPIIWYKIGYETVFPITQSTHISGRAMDFDYPAIRRCRNE